MKTLLKLIVAAVLIVGLLMAGTWLFFDGDRIRPQIQAQLQQALGREVAFGEIELLPWRGSLRVAQIRISDDPAFSDKPFLQAEALEVDVRLWPLITERALRVSGLRLRAPSVFLRQNRKGEWNFASLGAAAPAKTDPAAGPTVAALSIERLRIIDGQLSLEVSAAEQRLYSGVQLAIDDFDPQRSFPLTLELILPVQGRLSLSGEVGPWQLGNALATPLQAELEISGMDLAASGFVGASSDIRGRLEFKGEIEAKQGVLSSAGRAEIGQLRLLGDGEAAGIPILLDYRAEYDLKKRSGVLKEGRLGSGEAGLSLSGQFNHRRQALRLNLQASADQVAVDSLQALLPSFGVRLPADSSLRGGDLTVQLAIKGPLDALVIEGPVELRDSAMQGYSLGAQLSSAMALAGIRAPENTHINHARLQLRRDSDGLRLSDIDSEVRELGAITGEGAMAADGSLDFQMRARLDRELLAESQSGSGLARFSSGAMDYAATRGLKFSIGGSIDAPKLRADKAALTGALVSGLLAPKSDQDEESDQDAESEQEDPLKAVLGELLRKKRKDKD